MYTTHCGEKRENYESDPTAAVQVDDSKMMSVYVNAAGEIAEEGEEGSTLTNLAASKWARRLGRGYAFGTEY